MRAFCASVLAATLAVALASRADAQAIVVEGDIETKGQLVSTVATGTPPLVVSSTSHVANLNADLLDGIDATGFAMQADLTSLQLSLLTLQTVVLGVGVLPGTGQTQCYDAAGVATTCGSGVGAGQDGHLRRGLAWPSPRFLKRGDGTVEDLLTGLLWLEDASCFTVRNWAAALSAAAGLFDGATHDPSGADCGLSDGSVEGQWRLPNEQEVQSLLHYGVASPALPNTAGAGQWSASDPFTGVVSSYYWTSTTYPGSTDWAWVVDLTDGELTTASKQIVDLQLWPVRGGF